MNILDHTVLFEKYFEEISRIPRGSGNEAGMVRYLSAFAEERGLRIYTDELNNVVIYKEASPGYEDAPTVIMQSHIDMVCVKEPWSSHCFETDPLELIKEGNIVHANGTSLGADDGTGVALTLAVLDDENCKHPAIEAFFTASEEVGMIGAKGFDYSKLKGRRLIGLDSGGENHSSVCGAGGVVMKVTLSQSEARRENSGGTFILRVGGLLSGHSGQCIDMERGNAIKIAVSILREYARNGIEVEIAGINGGSETNVIPASCEVEFAVSDESRVAEITEEFACQLREDLRGDEPDLEIGLEKTNKAAYVWDADFSARMVRLLTLLPYGRKHKSTSVEGFITASCNLAIVHTDSEGMCAELFARGETEHKLNELSDEISAAAVSNGAEAEETSRTPCWIYNEGSYMRKVAAELMPKTLGKPFVPDFEHGGLECGYFANELPGVDIFVTGSVGRAVHSAKEWMELDSAHRVYNFLLAFLAALKE